MRTSDKRQCGTNEPGHVENTRDGALRKATKPETLDLAGVYSTNRHFP